MEVEKKINKEAFIATLESALTSAYKKMYGEAKPAMVKLNPEKATIKIYSYKTVVDEVTDPDKEISLAEARLIKKSYKVGDTVLAEESTKDFGRIAAQTAKQVVMQKLKEMERQMAVDELSEKEDELLTTVVKRVENGTVYVQLASTHTEGVMLPEDQIPGEKYNVSDRVKVYVKRIKDSFKGTQIQVTRSNIGFVRKLFELEIPEVANGDIVIKNISRDAGNRTKVALYTEKTNLDPIGTCVGFHGQRIDTITSELNGEKIDLMKFMTSSGILCLICYLLAALGPYPILGLIGCIMAFAGLINFINMIITNIITRRHEFATMQSIGMTGKQLRRLMVYEGIYYAAGADIIGGAVAAILAVTVLKSALNGPSMWFFTLNITLVPVLVIGVLYLLLAAVIPLIVLHFFNKGTVVERLRTSE